MRTKVLDINVESEIGELEGVVIHRPGPEIENMTPANAERALYSDILNLPVAIREYDQLEGVLNKVTKTFDVKDLLTEVMSNQKVKEDLIANICTNEAVCNLGRHLLMLDNEELARQLIEGVVQKKETLTTFLSKQRYALRPLHNFFFTRDASVSIGEKVLISKMASKVRKRETHIMEAIFDFHSSFSTSTFNPNKNKEFNEEISIEGGDVLVAREDILLVGVGARTTTQGVDFLIRHFKNSGKKKYILIQELPYEPESFIHLDMVFTLLDKNVCMVYDPIILKPNRYQTVQIHIEGGKVVSIKEQENLLTALKKLDMDLEPVFCGGSGDPWIQQREQWHSGANFFAFAPGKILGYERNMYTIEELNKHGFEILKADHVINGKANIAEHKKCVVTIEGSELPRGGGGARCMTMPIRRKAVNW
jgi:arginine deiminase